jgi:hypothetical protein
MRKLFPSQLDDEKIYLVVREHWVLLALKFILWCVFAAALVMFKNFAANYLPFLYQDSVTPVTLLFTQVYTLFLILSLFIIWVLYYLNVQIITNKRIVDINQVGLFSHTISELHLENIEDVTSQTNGLLGTIFNYGSVYVQTAGSVERFTFQNVPNPAHIEKLTLDLYEQLPGHQNP